MEQRIDIGMDGGGTGCRVVVSAGGRQAVASGRAANVVTDPAGAEAALRGALAEALGALGLGFNALADARIVAGLAGCRLPGVADAFAMRLPYLAYVVEDSVTALEGAFGGGDGTLASLGTGSFFIRRDGRGLTHQGGWGFDLGDDLSAAWLGREALAGWLRIEDGTDPGAADDALIVDLRDALGRHPVLFARDARPGDFAALAPLIMAATSPLASALQTRLIGGLARRLERLGHPEGAPWVLTGGLGAGLAARLAGPIAAGLRPPGGSALDGALAMARALP